MLSTIYAHYFGGKIFHILHHKDLGFVEHVLSTSIGQWQYLNFIDVELNTLITLTVKVGAVQYLYVCMRITVA